MSHSAGSPAPRMMPRRWCALLTTVLIASLAMIALPGAASAADLNATPSNLSSVYASAQGGDVIHLAAGNYGGFGGGSKSSVVTLTAQSGATATISPSLGAGVNNLRFDGVTIDGLYSNGARNTSFVNARFTGLVRVDTPASVSNANLVFDRDTFDGLSATASSYEGRLTVRGYDNSAPVGVRITNSHFGNGGCSDGVQVIGGAYGVEVGPGNEFSAIKQSGCAAHVDSIQLYGSSHTQIVGNYFHDNDTIIMAPDGGEAENVANNVMVGAGYAPAVQMGGHRASVFAHNVVKNLDAYMDAKSGEPPGANDVLRDNVVVNGSLNAPSSKCTNCTVSHNLFNANASGSDAITATPQFTGGANPTSYTGYKLAAGSPGTGNASDGTDRGINPSGGSTPPPDTTAPDTTITSGPTGTTNDSTPTFAFTASEANSVFECRVDSGSWVDCSSPWTTSALSDGAHSVSVRATDVAGNTDGSPATRAFTVSTAPPPDTTAPDTTITSGPNSTTNDSTPTFAFTSSEANSVFECRVDSGAWADCTSPWTTTALSDGAHGVSVRATDVAGNTDASPATRSFTVDTTPPADTTAPDTTISSGPTGTVTSTSASFAFTSTESGSTFECKLDTGAYAACTSPKAYNALADGSHTFSVRATDAAGNVDASPATRSWTVQSPPADHQPAAAYVYGPSSPTAGQVVTFDASSATCQDTPCSYTWADDGTDGAGGTQWPLGTGRTMTFTFQDPGVKNVRVTVADADGDTDSTMKAVTVAPASPPADTTAPDTAITSGPSGATSDSTPTFAFTATESGSTFRCRVDSGAWASCTSPWTTSTLADGSHTATVRATDAAGNTDATPASRTFTIDTQAPSTTIDSAPPALSVGSSATVAFSSSESGATFECQLDGGAWTACTSPKTYTGLTLGGHSVKVRATDAAGNVDATPGSASWTSVALLGSPAGAPTVGGTTGSANDAPTVTLAAPTAGATFSSTLSMAASATDDHGVRRVEFWVDGARVARDTVAPYAATYTAGRTTSYGVHTVTARAFDAAGRARSAAVTVTRVRAAGSTQQARTTSSKGRARAASASSDDRQNMLVAVSMWRIATAPADGSGTLLRGRGMPGRSATVSLTSCGNASGAIAAVMYLNAGADGTLYARQPGEDLCILRVRPFGNS